MRDRHEHKEKTVLEITSPVFFDDALSQNKLRQLAEDVEKWRKEIYDDWKDKKTKSNVHPASVILEWARRMNDCQNLDYALFKKIAIEHGKLIGCPYSVPEKYVFESFIASGKNSPTSQRKPEL